ncbi:hypothetical protein [Sphingomonas sanguinis]|jgi:hypothetical protein|uniref:Cytochrome C oxidase assembly protein n=1 Tax=Sphingomonas sanguinis TaxID=33051 RepID=A0A7Y7QZ52_9SPHN|nr:hypothetical protein [Sphingomonas sanguinis]MBZ6383650.1 hypothetical protein [Sphingomonas sanguinis]NNG48127.1 hypothetical protein [Sphingomonas sanguinis]NNG53829.1 hypothetical protein [Sphingomonas sanguinis]NVP32944.1 hypothetical protein [Sphingomonas sanguinis]
MTPDDSNRIRRKQRARATAMALLLGFLVVLIFFITLSKIRAGMHG